MLICKLVRPYISRASIVAYAIAIKKKLIRASEIAKQYVIRNRDKGAILENISKGKRTSSN